MSTPPIWELKSVDLKPFISNETLLPRFQTALYEFQPIHATKKAKTEHKTIPYRDPYYIWTQIKERDDQGNFTWDETVHDEIPDTMGGVLHKLTPVGILNAISHEKHFKLPAKHNLLNQAHGIYRKIQTQLQADLLRTTPSRIVKLLAPECPNFSDVQRRVYETVTLGQGLHVQDEKDALPTAALPVHDIEKFKKCKVCGNNDQAEFILDRRNGDVICSNCGTVVSESIMHEGSAYRRFEGEADRNHHGDSYNRLFSTSHNLGTSLSTTGTNTGNILRNAHAYTELNLSQFGKKDKRTREGYKDQHKREAFRQMQHVGDTLRLHDAVVQRAKEIFAGFRDDRELVQQFHAVIAACLCLAFEELSKQGKAILKQEQQQTDVIVSQNARAQRRNQLHHAKLAGKGGLLLDFESALKEKEEKEEKLTTAWNLDDCRNWLLEAARKIAKEWASIRDSGGPEAKSIPLGSIDDLEGILVEHGIKICEFLEEELQAKSNTKKLTPRADMTKLSIKWQHAHERGSGGSGGVGGSGNGPSSKAGKTAGQILQRQTAKKLGSLLNDQVAADAIHKELRSVIARQDTKKTQLLREEASRQRLNQMKRKPWLQARIQA